MKTHGSGIPLLIFFNTCFSSHRLEEDAFLCKFLAGNGFENGDKEEDWNTGMTDTSACLCVFYFVVSSLDLLCIYQSLLTHWRCLVHRDLILS